jgi:hypothetical protein
MTQKKRPNIVSVHLSPRAKADLDKACADRGMTIKSLLGRLISWFVERDMTEQSIVLGQIEETDITTAADLIGRRRGKKRATGSRGARRR